MVTAAKRTVANSKLVDKERLYTLDDGIKVLKSAKPVKFDETVTIALNLGIDVKKTEQTVRGAVSLPHGTGRSRKVIAFVKDPAKQEAARKAGALEVGSDELVKKVSDGWTDFDVAIAAPDMMGLVGKLGKVLGPQGKMPTPKSGTVTADVEKAVREFAAGKVEFRADAAGTVHAPVGKRSFEPQALAENVRAFVAAVNALRPAATKGQFIRKVSLANTMGPGVNVDPAL
ncbi:MAG TPA: 50S ribosomal protein L1 [Planctomycetota bacterium]|nr:50S ribosomal protein L1 [Planctomycetota bacterium]